MSAIALPKDPRHQRFADNHLAGMSLTEAYLRAGYKVSRASAGRCAKRLAKTPAVLAYLENLRQEAAKAAVLTVEEKRRFFARIVRVPLARIDPDNPEDPNADLVESYRRSDTETGSSIAVKKLSPLAAIEADNKLSGDGQPEAGAVSELAKALCALAGPVLPADRM